MKVTILKTGKTEEYNDSYAARLIEQGKAVPARLGDKQAEKKGK